MLVIILLQNGKGGLGEVVQLGGSWQLPVSLFFVYTAASGTNSSILNMPTWTHTAYGLKTPLRE